MKLSLISKARREWAEEGGGREKVRRGENQSKTIAEMGMCLGKRARIFNVDPIPNREKKVHSVFALFTGFELLYCLDITHNLEVKDLLTWGLC